MLYSWLGRLSCVSKKRSASEPVQMPPDDARPELGGGEPMVSFTQRALLQEAALMIHAEGDPLDETSNPTGSGRTSPPPSSQPPSPPARTAPEKVPQKKGPGKKTKKLGNNQYTKQRELASQDIASSPHSKKRQLATTTGHTSSGDEQLANGNTNNSHPANTSHSTNKNSPGGGRAAENGTHKAPAKTGKGKQKFLNGVSSSKQPVALADLSLADMERRVDAMSAFMQRAQLEMAGYNNPAAAAAGANNGGVGGAGAGATGGVGAGVTSQPASKPAFDELGSMEMADEVSRSLENWKRQFGVLAQ